MKFGLFYEMQGASDRSDRALYQEHLDQFRLADELGYDCLWLAELHFQRAYSVLPAPLMLAAAASQVTQRIRLGMGISVLPINQPLRLAEEIATLDILSNGRVDWGIGRGHPMTGIYDHFNIDIDQSKALFREHLDIIRLAWTEEEFSFDGKFHTIDSVRVVPKPVQKPTPPTFVSAFSPDTFDLAGEYGFNLFLPAQVIPVEQLKQAIAGYHAALDKYRPCAFDDGRKFVRCIHPSGTLSPSGIRMLFPPGLLVSKIIGGYTDALMKGKLLDRSALRKYNYSCNNCFCLRRLSHN